MKRTLPGIALAAVWVVLLLIGSANLFHAAMVVVAAVCGYEYGRMTFGQSGETGTRLFMTAVLALPTLFAGAFASGAGVVEGLLLSFILLAFFCICRYSRIDQCYDKLCRMGFGILYIGLLFAFLIKLRFLPEGGKWLVVLSAVTAGSDTGAYLFGTAFGRHKLCPAISPNKSVEGAVGGVVSGVAAASLLTWLLFDDVNWPFILVSSAVLTTIGILGDLLESIIKRGTGTKDSGTILAGHGGALDRVDSLLLAGPFFYYMLTIAGYS